jgi:hypothetical protein
MHMLAALYGSWLNWIEAEFAALRYFGLNGTDHGSHAEQNAAIAGYVRWHNTRASPRVNFATDSPIRTWTDYSAKAAGQATGRAAAAGPLTDPSRSWKLFPKTRKDRP